MNKPLRHHETRPRTGRIGPNAVTRVAEALAGDPDLRLAVFRRAGCLRHLAAPPTAMVDEHDVAALHEALHVLAGEERAAAISREAGRLTADYLLANRIPRAAQWILRRLPRRLALRILARAVARHAWTFAGSGVFTYAFEPDLVLQIENSPVARLVTTHAPACTYYAAVFEGLFAGAIGMAARVTETHCEACGHGSCRFILTTVG
ncbi:bacteriochlorophyll 4-vinyl reductase [uncultured Alsobacter sp.]|uniref:bacteriochlorophyll 4-vinyl reductase n=1 Tax=uncultured Alsobacter sp. TaxID=1748258 RepID=UPI0025F542B8|nr:bacteriochlorophyll 4-vinyl reductase [uncultured Alsobacter sp.]